MKLEREALEQWLALRNPRESLLILIAGFAIIYLFWNLLFELSLHNKKENLAKQNQGLLQELSTQKQNLSSIEELITSSAFTRNLLKQQKLSTQERRVGKQLKTLELGFVQVEWLAQITNDIIAQQQEVVLVSMKSFPEEPWLKTKDAKGSYLNNMQGVYSHKMEVEFRGTYFNVIAFLGHLEKLPWHLYWDSLDYKVSAYPEAKVVARFYVLSNQKG